MIILYGFTYHMKDRKGTSKDGSVGITIVQTEPPSPVPKVAKGKNGKKDVPDKQPARQSARQAATKDAQPAPAPLIRPAVRTTERAGGEVDGRSDMAAAGARENVELELNGDQAQVEQEQATKPRPAPKPKARSLAKLTTRAGHPWGLVSCIIPWL